MLSATSLKYLVMANRRCIFVFICFLILQFGCYKEKQALVNDVIINMTGNQKSIAADGVSTQLITIEVPSNSADINNSISLTTTKGLFDIVNKNTITVIPQNVIVNNTIHKIAFVNLISSTDEGIAYVTASIKNYISIDTIFFITAYADQIKILTDKLNLQISNTSEVIVTVKISRSPGKGIPTPNQNITLNAMDNKGSPVGRFRNFNTFTDASGNCINYFSIPLTTRDTFDVKLLTSIRHNLYGEIISDSTLITAY